MTKELFALYLVFSTPTGVEERFVMERENCKNLVTDRDWETVL